MFTQVFNNAEVMSSIVLGGATLGAAGLNFLHEGRKARRYARETGTERRWLRRPLLVLALAVFIAAGWSAYALGAFARVGLPAPKLNRLVGANAPKAEASTKPAATPTAAIVPVLAGKREDWLQSEGYKLYYRFSRYLPDACPGNPIAIGNWPEGEARPVAATCVDEEWLSVDFAPLIADGRIAPNITYCMNFRAETGAWGLHVPDRAPGLDSVVVPAARVPLGQAIGVRYIKGLRERVVPTAEAPRATC